jgi:hypothetical protein
VRKREFLQRKRLSELTETIKLLGRENEMLLMDNMKISLANQDVDFLEIRKIQGKYEEILRLKVDLIRRSDKKIVLNKIFKNEQRSRKWSSPIDSKSSYSSEPAALEVKN